MKHQVRFAASFDVRVVFLEVEGDDPFLKLGVSRLQIEEYKRTVSRLMSSVSCALEFSLADRGKYKTLRESS